MARSLISALLPDDYQSDHLEGADVHAQRIDVHSHIGWPHGFISGSSANLSCSNAINIGSGVSLGVAFMYVLDNNEFAVLELLAMKPLSYFPPFPQMIATRLARRGLVIFKDGRWHPTAEGFSRIGRNGEPPTPSARRSSGGAQRWCIAPPKTAAPITALESPMLVASNENWDPRGPPARHARRSFLP